VQALDFHHRRHVIVDTKPVLLDLRWVPHIVPGCYDDRANIQLHELGFLGEVDGLEGATRIDALVALNASIAIDRVDRWHGLRHRHIDGLARAETFLKLIRHINRADLGAQATPGTTIEQHVAWLALHRNLEVADISVHLPHLRVGQEVNAGVLTHIDHLRRFDADGAVHGRERLVELCHAAADRRRLLDQVGVDLHVGEVEGRTDTCDSSTDHHRASRDRHVEHLQGLAVGDPGDCSGHKLLGFFGCCLLFVGMDPGVMFADVRHLEQEGVQSCLSNTCPEGGLMHRHTAGRHDNTIQSMLLDLGLNQGLSWVRAHIPVLSGNHDPGERLGIIDDLRHRHDTGDVRAAVTDKHTNPGTIGLQGLLVYHKSIPPSCVRTGGRVTAGPLRSRACAAPSALVAPAWSVPGRPWDTRLRTAVHLPRPHTDRRSRPASSED